MQIFEHNASTTSDAISEFESRWNVQLPLSYRAFLIKSNGGRPANTLIRIGRPHQPFESVQIFLGIETGEPTTGVPFYMGHFSGRLPHSLVPIARQDFGNLFFLDLRNGGHKIMFWDQRHFWGTGEWREADLYYVADSFEAFVADLMPNPY